MIVNYSLPLLAGLIFYRLHQKYYRLLPKIRLWKLELFPSLKITIKGKIIHLHHWPSFVIILSIALFLEGGFLTTPQFKGFLTGGIIQGLLDPTSPKLFTFLRWYRLSGGKEK